MTAFVLSLTMVDMLDVVALIAIPAVIATHWRRVLARHNETGSLSRYGSAERFRMGDVERVVTLVGTIIFVVDLAVAANDGATPNALIAGAAVVFAAYLFIDFYVGLKHPHC